MDKTGQIKLYAKITAALFIVAIIALIISLFIRSSLMSNKMITFNDPVPVSSSLRGTISDKDDTFLAMDSRKTISSANGTKSSIRVRVYPYQIPSLLRLLGQIDDNAQGVSGIEKLCNEYLVSSENKDKSMTDGVMLTLDIRLIENINKAFRGFTGNKIHILVMDTTTGGVSAVWDNDNTFTPDENDLYALGDLSSSQLMNAFLVSIMAEIDRTRLFDYKCITSDLCPTPHGLVTVDNMSICSSAVHEMLKLYKEDEIAEYLNSLSFDNYSISSYMNSSASALEGRPTPKLHILDSVRVNGEKSNIEVEYTQTPKMSERISAFLLNQLSVASKNERIIKIGKYLVYIRGDEKSISDITRALRTILS